MFGGGTFELITFMAGIAALIIGIFELLTRTLVGRNNSKYDMETIRDFTKKEGAVYILVGFGGILMSMAHKFHFLPELFFWVGFLLAFSGIIIETYISKKCLRDKAKDINKK